MKTVKLVVKGRVQRVGYRNEVSRVADELNIQGEIRNLEDKTVEIIAQGTKENIKTFCKKIKVQEWPIRVKTVRVQIIGSDKIYEDFSIIRGDQQKETAKRADVAAVYLQTIRREMSKEATAAKEKTLLKTAKEKTLLKTAREKTLNKFSQGTKTEFKHLDKKYGSISQKLDGFKLLANKMDKLSEAILLAVNRK